MSKYDVIFVGAGHNALVAAAYLAREGRSVLLLDRNDRPGGYVRTDELTLPGFRHDTYAAVHTQVLLSAVWRELGPELTSHGLSYVQAPFATGVSLSDGRSTVMGTDVLANAAEAERLQPGDGDRWMALCQRHAELAVAESALFSMDLSSPQAKFWLRKIMFDKDSGTLSAQAADWLLSARAGLPLILESDVLHAELGNWVLHYGQGPDDAGSLLSAELVAVGIQAGGTPMSVGGSGALTDALAAIVTAHGGEIVCGAHVERIVCDSRGAQAVETADSRFEASTIVASTTPDQLYGSLLSEADIPSGLLRQAQHYSYGRGCVQVHLALDQAPQFADARLAETGEVLLSDGLDATAASVCDERGGRLPARSMLSIDFPSLFDSTRAPEGKHTCRLQVLDVPCRPTSDAAGELNPDGRWSPELGESFADRVVAQATEHIPNLSKSIIGRSVVTSADIAAFNPSSGPGDPYAGAQTLALRPLPGQPTHRTAIPGLYLTGAATWPGHGVSGNSGRIVAKELLRSEAGLSNDADSRAVAAS